jgi:glycosyltransferase involved in cell wall biosynthesis
MSPVPIRVISSRPSGAPAPKVSVAMITYNHETFITQAVESVMMQETDFPYELVIGEDCSSDRTRDICIKLQRKYPDRIKLLLPEENLGIQPNFVQTLKACEGEYIALLEGDDYWTAVWKLQKQIQFLETHPECSSCSHSVETRYEAGATPPARATVSAAVEFYSLTDVLLRPVAQTCSIVFRNHFKGTFPEWFSKLGFGDWALMVLNAERGLLGYLNEVMGCYRVHTGGAWSASTRIWQLEQLIVLYESFAHHFRGKYRLIAKQHLSRRYCHLSLLYLDEHRTADAIKCAWKSIIMSPFNPHASLSKRGKRLLLCFVPSIWRARFAQPQPPLDRTADEQLITRSN